MSGGGDAEERRAEPDGGHSRRGFDALFDNGAAGFMVETRERLSSVENQQENISEKLDRIESKVDETSETAGKVEAALDTTENIDREILPEVEKNTRVRMILRWLGISAVGLSGAATTWVLAFGGPF